MYPKYVVYDDPDYGLVLVIGHVEYHRDLGDHRESIRGGGLFLMDNGKRTVTLSGSSHEFGTPSEEDLAEAVGNGVYTRGVVAQLPDKYRIFLRDEACGSRELFRGKRAN